MSLELEKKVVEFEGDPTGILGLDGWILRTVPQNKRKEFLKAFEKAIRVAYHPDHVQGDKEKVSREKYIQAVAQAVDYLTADSMAYDLAVEMVPARRNKVVELTSQLENARESGERTFVKMSKELKDVTEKFVQAKDNEDRWKKMLESGSRLNSANARYAEEFSVEQLSTGSPLVISGRYLDLGNEVLVEKLYNALFRTQADPLFVKSRFGELVKEGFAKGERVSYLFKNDKVYVPEKRISIGGGMSAFALREFLVQKKLMTPNFREELKNTEFAAGVKAFFDVEYKRMFEWHDLDKGFREFLTPHFFLNSPILLYEDYTSGDKSEKGKARLFYAEGVNPHPRI